MSISSINNHIKKMYMDIIPYLSNEIHVYGCNLNMLVLFVRGRGMQRQLLLVRPMVLGRQGILWTPKPSKITLQDT